MRKITLTCVLTCLLATGAAFAGPPAVTITPIVYEGFNVPGVGDISSGFGASERHTVNDNGEWLVRADTNHADTNADVVVLRGTGHSTGSLFLRENQAMLSPAGSNLSSVDSMNINNSGNTAFNHFLRNTGGTNNDSGIYFNSDLVIQESNLSTAPGLSANTPWIGFFESRMNNNNLIAVMGSVDDPNIASTVDRALVTINPFSFVETLVCREGSELAPGRFVTEMGTSTHEMSLNDSGHILLTVDMDGSTADDTGVVLWNGASLSFLAREGDPSPIGGRNWGTLDTVIDMNNNGDWVMRGDLDGATTDDSLIVRNGTDIIAREGSGLPAIGGFNFTTFGSGAVLIDDSANVVWYGDWDDPDTTRDTGIFWNDQLIVQEGVTMVDGVLLTGISAVEANMSMSDNGQWIIFEGTLQNGIDGAFMIEIPEPGTIGLLAIGCGLALARRRRA